MYAIYEHCHGERKKIRSYDHIPTDEEIGKATVEYLSGLGYKSYYTRRWTTPNGEIWIDYGSWSTFLVVAKEGENADEIHTDEVLQ